MQHRQQRDWLNQQVAVLQQKEEHERMSDAEFEYHQRRVLAAREAQEVEAGYQSKRSHKQAQAFNLDQLQEKRLREAIMREREEAMGQAEVQMMIESEFLNENGLVREGAVDSFKGFTPQQRKAILDEQKKQVADMLARKEQMARMERAQDQDSEAVRRALVRKDREKMAHRKHLAVQTRLEQEQQKAKTQLRYDYLDNVVYTNPIGDDFFSQFGKSVR